MPVPWLRGSGQPLAFLAGGRITVPSASAFTEHSSLFALIIRTLDFGSRAQPERPHLDTLNYVYTHPLYK